MKKILLTGHNGYVGSVMAERLIERGYDVFGLDTEYFSECTLFPGAGSIPSLRIDLRHVETRHLEGYDAVIHLAALSNDPLGKLHENWTVDINHRASVRLAKAARQAGVRRFVFSSSCIMYGMSEAQKVDETAALNPLTAYARSKVDAERDISQLANDHFSPIFMRNGTIYGASPRMRFDTVLNNLMGSALSTGEIVIHSDGMPWRPVVNIEDVASAFMAVLEAPRSAIHNEAFNVGADCVNQQIRNLAEAVARIVPNCEIVYTHQADADQRTYITDFSKIARKVPEFQVRYPIDRGIEILYHRLMEMGFSSSQFTDKKFTRLRWFNYLLEQKRLDDNLFWTH